MGEELMADIEIERGAYHPRMARPFQSDDPRSLGWNPEDVETSDDEYEKTKRLAESAGQLHHLKEHLEEICRVVYACQDNYKVYGHEIRNVLIVASTEVEAQWYGVLKANGHKFKNGEQRPSSQDYVELLRPLRLDEYSVRFPFFPAMEVVWPFKGWNSKKPTKSLDWYAVYNKVKHDRETHFQDAKLLYAFKAAAAYFVMLCAEHGREVAAPEPVAANKFFYLKDRPKWEPAYRYAPTSKNGRFEFDKCHKYFADKPEKLSKALTVKKILEPLISTAALA
jgi:hypothetical protein